MRATLADLRDDDISYCAEKCISANVAIWRKIGNRKIVFKILFCFVVLTFEVSRNRGGGHLVTSKLNYLLTIIC